MPRRTRAKLWKGRIQFVNKYRTLDYKRNEDEELGEIWCNDWMYPVHDPWLMKVNLTFTLGLNCYKSWMEIIDYSGYRYLEESRDKSVPKQMEKFQELINKIVLGYLRRECAGNYERILILYLIQIITNFSGTELVIFRDFRDDSKNRMEWKTNLPKRYKSRELTIKDGIYHTKRNTE